MVVILLVGIYACQAQQQAADAVDCPYQGSEQGLKGFECHTGREGNPLRAHGGKGLGGDFGKHQHDDGDDHRRHCRTTVTQPADSQDGSHGGGKVVDEIIADQDHRQQAVGALEQPFHAGGGAMPLAGQMTKPVTIDRHHAGFTTGEEGRAKNQKYQGAYQPPVREGIQEKSRFIRQSGRYCSG